MDSEETEKFLLVAKADNVKHISSLLKAVNFKDVGVFFATEHGLKIVVEDSKCVQANAFIGSEIFQDYQLSDDTVAFRVDLNTFIECLTIFDGCSLNPGVTTALKLTYKEYGSPIKLLLEEGGIITDCSLRTMEVFDILDFSIPAESATSKIILRSSDFKDILNDIDNSSDYVEFTFSQEPEFFKILTSGIAGKCSVEIPSKSEIIEQFVCNATISVKYKYRQVKPFLKCMNISQKTLIRTNEEGLLCCQFMVQVDSHTCYMEYFR
ncbi:cell cycle checkpoint protein RAD1-like isoform X3 [Daktulosphaira vitifoliae]|uniref:cell cycle checkpoint protein RAD1-like isoform X3 n=1 Tax=Daktulosphaira vitifoliae TaxID=58002 RepID=UPI0021A9E6FF|nr:cell cycle checkpoint protein RAD1-like isoform X3 [Daktulosphaira vitifoliae]